MKRVPRMAAKAAGDVHWSVVLERVGACRAALTWARTQPTAPAAWRRCQRADWMLWIAGRFCDSKERRKEIALAACACARTALRYVPKGEKRPVECILTTERWARGRATLEEVRGAREAAFAVDAATSAAAKAAAAAVYASAAAFAVDAAYTAYTVYAAADARAYAASAAADDGRRAKTLASMAKIVRAHLTMPSPTGTQ